MEDLKKGLYKLPFSKHNNPNGWIEPTTFCQLKCPHCYRGADKENFRPIHRDIKEVLLEVDELIKIRNIQTLTIAGGEPLLYPDLDELIRYAVERKLSVYLITNGLLINKKRLIELKDCGATRVMIHIDKYQNREGASTEEKVNVLRNNYCNIFRDVNGISLGFMMPISKDNFQDLDVLISFFKDNVDVVREVGLTVLCEVLPEKELPNEKKIDAIGIFERVRELYGLKYCAYLGKTNSSNISWIFAHNFFADNSFLGSIDKKVAEFIQNDFYKRNKKYLFVSDNNFSFNFLKLIFNQLIIRIFLLNLIKVLTKKIYSQSVFIINTPQKIAGQWDFCDGCPDAMFYNGDLVPSCLLERVKEGESIKIIK